MISLDFVSVLHTSPHFFPLLFAFCFSSLASAARLCQFATQVFLHRQGIALPVHGLRCFLEHGDTLAQARGEGALLGRIGHWQGGERKVLAAPHPF